MLVSGSVKVYVACTYGAKKFSSGGRPPEDSKLPSAKRKQTFGLEKTSDLKSLEAAQRWGSIVMNDLESIPFGLLIFGAGIMSGADPTVHYRAMVAFTTARCLHTYAYANAIQPMRSLCHGVGVMATLVGLGNAIGAVI
ncbi:hypothetical protein PsorP6_013308 [Peronosclerospora sorghi]|uniref:Uncharacterized protein n=1 Tax=Peronosclerospora sorghi TaxID=230839 RepID=A0ACC0WHJ1_9STRA|nr:hypothetical protein PsorP6_013308 [Peronosclerospora sorghi]